MNFLDLAVFLEQIYYEIQLKTCTKITRIPYFLFISQTLFDNLDKYFFLFDAMFDLLISSMYIIKTEDAKNFSRFSYDIQPKAIINKKKATFDSELYNRVYLSLDLQDNIRIITQILRSFGGIPLEIYYKFLKFYFVRSRDITSKISFYFMNTRIRMHEKYYNLNDCEIIFDIFLLFKLNGITIEERSVEFCAPEESKFEKYNKLRSLIKNSSELENVIDEIKQIPISLICFCILNDINCSKQLIEKIGLYMETRRTLKLSLSQVLKNNYIITTIEEK